MRYEGGLATISSGLWCFLAIPTPPQIRRTHFTDGSLLRGQVSRRLSRHQVTELSLAESAYSDAGSQP